MKAQLVKNVCKTLALSMTVGAMLVNNGIVANAQPKVMKDGTVFDAEYYAQRYADVVAVYGTDEAALFQHYTDYGKAENRAAVKTPSTSTFDPVYYAKQNPDVVAAYGSGNNNLYQHYLQHGKEEGRKPTANAKGSTSNATSSTVAPAPASAEAPAQTTASTQTATPAQTNTISDEEAHKIFLDYANNLHTKMSDTVNAFFDADGNKTIDQAEWAGMLSWAVDRYNTVNKGQITEDEMIVMGRALHDGTFKLPDSLYHVQ